MNKAYGQRDYAPMPRLSIVAPCYNEEESLEVFCGRATAAARRLLGEDFEVVLVDDGSKDATWSIMERLCGTDPRIVAVRLLRNHGHQLAATAGLSVSRGERVMLIDADLQDPPELLAEMMALMDQGAHVVYGQRLQREGESAFKKFTAHAFYRLLTRLSAVAIPEDTGDFRLMERRIVDALLMMPERQRFIRGMVSWVGGKQIALKYNRDARYAGESKYPLAKMLHFATDAITSFSTVPLRLSIWLGTGAAVLAFAMLVYTIVEWFFGHTIQGWSSLMTAVTFFAAVQLIVLGVVGEYIGRVMHEVKGRPLFLIDEVASTGQHATIPAEFSRLGFQERVACLGSQIEFAPVTTAPAAAKA